MPQLRLALNQTDSTVGDLADNSEAVVRWTRHAVEGGAHLVAFPEMQLTGYPVEDLALRPSFVRASRSALDALAGRLAAEDLGEVPVVVGYLDREEREEGEEGDGRPQDAAAVLYGGEVRLRFAKHRLPEHGVFDEHRHFAPGGTLPVIRVRGVDVALAIGEDLGQGGGRVSAARAAGPGLLLCLDAEPYEPGGGAARLERVRRRAEEAGCALARVAMIGGQDELVFDGDSIVVDASGAVLARAPQFEEGCVLVDLDLPAAGPAPRGTADGGLEVEHVILSAEPLPPYQAQVPGGEAERLGDDEEVYSALVIGLRAFTAKNGFSSVLLGLSGGIDSALVAAIACDALGAERVYGVSMPAGYSAEPSGGGAEEVARRTGLNYRAVPVAPMVGAYLGALGLGGSAEESLRARVRGTVLMGISDQEGHLVLATGDGSDAAGGFAPLKDVSKAMVLRLARWRNEAAERRGEVPPVPEGSIAESAGGGSVPEYAGVDGRGRRWPPGTRVSPRELGRDWRLPVTCRWGEGG